MPDKAGGPRIMHFDIESTNLSATFGTILCIGYKWHGEKRVYVPSILDAGRDNLDDHALVAAFARAWDEADYAVSWYGERFDLPMIRTKLLRYGEPPLAPKPHIDLWKTARKMFKAHSNRLAVWQELLGAEHSKTPIAFDAWLRAAQGDQRALREVKRHCELDVRVLEDVFTRMRPWLDNEPRRGLFTGEHDGCPSCGSADVRRKGFKAAQTRVYQQWVCNACGHWFRSRKAVDVSPRAA